MDLDKQGLSDVCRANKGHQFETFDDDLAHVSALSHAAVNLVRDEHDQNHAKRDATLIEHPKTIAALAAHQVADHEIVLRVTRPKKDSAEADFPLAVFSTRAEADNGTKNMLAFNFDTSMKEALRKAEAARLFLPDALPTHPQSPMVTRTCPVQELPRVIIDLRQELKARDDMVSLHTLAAGTITFEEFQQGNPVQSSLVKRELVKILEQAR
ncbi:hypothetical protein CDD80_3363 [Ophiocordyceps camponoti-rufipedis]|uniref:Uncharacterized protein n=1 Tax=Ophiocordyceps camponoti-rufipedis TaxID=2004952 RepID=A0A2C5ZP49_9HYPO|nr:hypothetical protein CDD80_3363 [Ophiocordyceps camponoti-rufipedis]